MKNPIKQQNAMKNIFLFHGSYGHPQENWFPWLEEQLSKIDCQVFIPHFPTPEHQSLENWFKVFETYEQYVDENSIFIGHSIGVAFLLKILEKQTFTIKGTIGVSGFCESLENTTFEELNRSFLQFFDWEKIQKSSKHFVLFHADNDPYVPLEYAQVLQKHLTAKLCVILNAGHFNINAGYTQFQEMFEEVESLLYSSPPTR